MNDKDTFRILLSTDNHLGFAEKDPIRGNDSFITFEEILMLSEVHKPDYILLGGDLFHENKPSLSSLFKCTELIRKYSFNNNPVNFKIVSDQSINFSHNENFSFANFNDENLNVGMPIFTIHGNHDDPIDQSNLCALDLFHASGLVNLFGKTPSVESITIRPILMSKGSTKIALYGLGAIRNERLHRLFQQNKVSFLRPTEQTDDWFSIFVIHQNRVKHGSTNYIPETFLPDFLDLVIWGHEHDCRINPEFNVTNEFYVSQPGSSVATSLCEGEATEKFIGILQVKGKEFRIERIKLQTIRPLMIENVVLEEEDTLSLKDIKINQKVEQFCHFKVKEMLSKVPCQLTGHEKQPKLPLIRLSVDYSGGFEMFSVMRFTQQYIDKVANPKDMLHLHRRREQREKEVSTHSNVVLNVKSVKNDGGLDAARVEDLVKQHFVKLNEKLSFLNIKELGCAVKMSVDKDNKDIVSKVVDLQIDKIQGHLKQRQTKEEYVSNEIKRLIEVFETMREDDDEEDEKILRQRLLLSSVSNSDQKSQTQFVDNFEEEENVQMTAKVSKRGGRGRGRGKASNTIRESMIVDDEVSTNFTSTGDFLRKRKTKSTDQVGAKLLKNENI